MHSKISVMSSDVIRFEAISHAARAAFERELRLPQDIRRVPVVKLSGFPPAVIEILLRPETWATMAGLGVTAWIAKRVGVFIDEFSKGIAVEAGRDTWTALMNWLAEFRKEQTQASEVAKQLEIGRKAAELQEGSPVQLVIGSPVGLREYWVAKTKQELEVADATLALLVMNESMSRASRFVISTREVLGGKIRATVVPSGFRLSWHERPWIEVSEDFLPDGTSIGDSFVFQERGRDDSNEG